MASCQRVFPAAAVCLGFPAADLETLIPAVIKVGSGTLDAFATVPGITPAMEAATAQEFRDAYAYALNRVFWTTIFFGVMVIIAACFIRDPLRYLTNHVAAHMEREVVLVGTPARTKISPTTV